MFTKKRPDGTYIPDLPFYTQIMPYLMPTRTEACIFFEQEFDVTRTVEYVRSRKRSGGARITLFYVILYAAIRAIAQRPRLNRFVSGYRYYQRNRISFNFIAKRDFSDDGDEVNVTMSFSPLLTLESFCKKIHEYISSIKEGTGTDTEKLNRLVTRLPRFFIKLFAWAIKFLDYHNGLPKSVIDSLPFYSTIFFTNVGSIGIEAPFHHNFEIGNCGLFCAIGKTKRRNVLNRDKTIDIRDKIKITFTYDDRITDGVYCARTLDIVRDLVENPEKLETPLELTAEQLAALALTEKELNDV
jgi:hypothetical protein